MIVQVVRKLVVIKISVLPIFQQNIGGPCELVLSIGYIYIERECYVKLTVFGVKNVFQSTQIKYILNYVDSTLTQILVV